jgi:hypothetical protein
MITPLYVVWETTPVNHTRSEVKVFCGKFLEGLQYGASLFAFSGFLEFANLEAA